MKKIGAILIVSLMLCNIINARTMKDFFLSIPIEIMPMLSYDNKLDCIDFIESKMKAKVNNAFGDVSELLLLQDDYLKLQESSMVLQEMAMLCKGKKDTLLCIITTYQFANPESKIEFYSKDWEKLSVKKYIKQPTIESFLDVEKKTEVFDGSISATFSKNRDIVFTFHRHPIDIDVIGEDVKQFLPIKYKWENGMYRIY